MKTLDIKLMKKFLKLAGSELAGEWLLVGGTLLPAIGLLVRTTVDIDIVGLGPKERAQTLELMQIADKLGLSIESINQAAAFFLKNVKHQKSDLIPIVKGPKATVFRPSVWLYWSLKIKRLSESDLIDCKEYFQFCRNSGDEIEIKALKQLVVSTARKTAEADRTARLQSLLRLL
ncbi:MAG: hypothetical protein COT74_04710 [Bdellovibrionales bacterium CG10_big_fil_rev_8_21_14_0_10_45_34]|nr:MAG: hypothetical protein COT74_04710 [Bdellovibrionales bacterium CG10_big_fil_rev_8_21_14_0_10_45_34]